MTLCRYPELRDEKKTNLKAAGPSSSPVVFCRGLAGRQAGRVLFFFVSLKSLLKN